MFELIFNFHVDMNFVDRLKELSFLDKDNIAQIVVLKSKTSDQVVIIANTHLIYNMGRGELKLGQILILLKSLNEVISLCDRAGYKNRSTFICGDFNSVPNSLLYNVLSEPNFSLFDIPSGQISNQIYAKYLNSADDLKHYTETTRKFDVTPYRLRSKFPVLEEKFIEILKGVKAAMTYNQDGFEYMVDVQDRREKIVKKTFSRAEFGIENTFFHSTYAYVNKSYYNQRPDDNSTNINNLIYKIKEQLPLFKIDRLTFENAMSHISVDFKANVDYIWYNLNNQLKPFRTLEVLNYDQLRLDRNYPNLNNPSDHLPLVADFYNKD